MKNVSGRSAVQNITADFIIVTDWWQAYNYLSQFQFENYIMNHSQQFMNPET